jgi:hypothetical protein
MDHHLEEPVSANSIKVGQKHCKNRRWTRGRRSRSRRNKESKEKVKILVLSLLTEDVKVTCPVLTKQSFFVAIRTPPASRSTRSDLYMLYPDGKISLLLILFLSQVLEMNTMSKSSQWIYKVLEAFEVWYCHSWW